MKKNVKFSIFQGDSSDSMVYIKIERGHIFRSEKIALPLKGILRYVILLKKWSEVIPGREFYRIQGGKNAN